MLRAINNLKLQQFAFALVLFGLVMMFPSCTKDSDLSELDSTQSQTSQRTNLVYPDIQNGMLMFADEDEYDSYLDQVMEMSTIELESYYDELGFVPIEVSYDEYFETIGYQIFDGEQDEEVENEEYEDAVENLFPFPNDPLLKKVANEYGEYGIGNKLYKYLTPSFVNINDTENLDEFLSMRETTKFVTPNSITYNEITGDTLIITNRDECTFGTVLQLKTNLTIRGFGVILNEAGEAVICTGTLSASGSGISGSMNVTENDFEFIGGIIPILRISGLSWGGVMIDKVANVTFFPDASCVCSNFMSHQSPISAIHDCIKDDDNRLREWDYVVNPDGTAVGTYLIVSYNTRAYPWRRAHVTTEVRCRKFPNVAPHGPSLGSKWNVINCRFDWFQRVFKERDCTEVERTFDINDRRHRHLDWKMAHAHKFWRDIRGNALDLPFTTANLQINTDVSIRNNPELETVSIW